MNQLWQDPSIPRRWLIPSEQTLRKWIFPLLSVLQVNSPNSLHESCMQLSQYWSRNSSDLDVFRNFKYHVLFRCWIENTSSRKASEICVRIPSLLTERESSGFLLLRLLKVKCVICVPNRIAMYLSEPRRSIISVESYPLAFSFIILAAHCSAGTGFQKVRDQHAAILACGRSLLCLANPVSPKRHVTYRLNCFFCHPFERFAI